MLNCYGWYSLGRYSQRARDPAIFLKALYSVGVQSVALSKLFENGLFEDWNIELWCFISQPIRYVAQMYSKFTKICSQLEWQYASMTLFHYSVIRTPLLAFQKPLVNNLTNQFPALLVSRTGTSEKLDLLIWLPRTKTSNHIETATNRSRQFQLFPVTKFFHE